MNCDFEATGETREDGRIRLICRNCHLDKWAKSEQHRRNCTNAIPTKRPPDEGPGRELLDLFKELGIKEKPGCGCKAKAREMNAWGIDGCREHFDEIVQGLKDNSGKYGFSDKVLAGVNAVLHGLLLNPRDPFSGIVREAIQRAELKERGPPGPPITRLNLIYHILPTRHKDNVWQWNVAELCKRLYLFNGRRIVNIATDDGVCDIEKTEKVVESFGSHDIEFLFTPNSTKMRDTVRYLDMLRMVQSSEANEATFVAQAKGVTKEDQTALRPWTLEMYRHNLDRWGEVSEILRSWPMCGIAKRYSHGKSNAGGWHYAGSFYWLRHDSWFGNLEWSNVDKCGWAIETHPAKVVHVDDAYCLAYDHIADPYEPETWEHVR